MEQIIEILKLIWYGHEVEGLVKGIEPVTTAAIIGGATSLFGSIFGASKASKRARRAAAERRRLENELKNLEKNRQPIINPYQNVEDISGMFQDLSGMVSNPYANLGVATKAAEIQIEQTDQALANTLDFLAATGASAGGATALARAAAQGKRGVAANIEQQELQNERLRAQGEARLELIQMREAGRLQGAQVSEALRLQQADVAAKDFEFSTRERRETEQLNRKQAQITNAAQAQANERANAAAILGSGIQGVTSTTNAYLQSQYEPNSQMPQNQEVRQFNDDALFSQIRTGDKIIAV